MRNVAALILALTLALPSTSSASAIRTYCAVSDTRQNGTSAAFVNLGTDHTGNATGSTLKFHAARKGPGTITVSAECTVRGGPTDSLNVDILVNGAQIPPMRGGDTALCVGAGNRGGRTMMASTTIPHRFARGDQRVRVRVRPLNGAEWNLDDVSLTVILQKR